MKKMLRALLGWLDRKFPDQVILTMDEHNALQGRIRALEGMANNQDEWSRKADERIKQADMAIKNLNVTLGLGGMADKFKTAPFHQR